MPLVLFDDAVSHVCRITRIISNSYGHGLLVGVGQSSRCDEFATMGVSSCDFELLCSQAVVENKVSFVSPRTFAIALSCKCRRKYPRRSSW